MKSARLNKDTDRQSPSDGAFYLEVSSYKCSAKARVSTMLTLAKRKHRPVYTGLLDFIFILHQKFYYLSTFLKNLSEFLQKLARQKTFPQPKTFSV